MVTRRTVLMSLAATSTAALTAGWPRRGRAADPIRIGYSGALSGPASFTGVDIRRGAEMAIDEVNAAGGIDGRPLELISRDDEHNPVRTVAQYRELVEREGVVAMIGATNSASMLAVAPIVNDLLRVPVICPQTDATEITENDAHREGRDNYIFRVGMYGTGQANFMVDTVVERFGHERVGLLTWTAGWGVTGRGELIRRLGEHGLTPISDETYDTADTDLTPQILKLREAGAQSILNYGLVRENTFVVQTKRQLGDTTPYVSAWGISGPAFWQAAGDAAEGVMSSTTIIIDGPQSPKREAFLEAYRERFNQNMDSPTSVFGAYDAVMMYALVMRRDGITPDVIRSGLENIPEFDGIIKHFDRPVFTRERHNAVTEEDMIMGRWTKGELLAVEYDGEGAYVVSADGKHYIDPATFALR